MELKPFDINILNFDNVAKVVDDIVAKLYKDVTETLRRHGGVVGISGGIDSSVTFALAVKALGSQKVLGLILPEKESSSESKQLALKLADKFKVQVIEEDITKALEGFQCYARRNEAVSNIFPEYDPNIYKMKIGLNKTGINQNLPPAFSLTIIDQNGSSKSKLIPTKEYLQIVAASNFKQRCRMSVLYYHAERLHYAVVGTPNKHEIVQGFFVKHGDGGADIMPIGHLYKTQVYQLARYLEIPNEIIKRIPTTDTYSAEQSQEEFFFQLPFKELDMIWYGYENGYDPATVGNILGKSEKEINLIFNNFSRKQKTTEYLRMSPIKNS